MIRLFNRNSWSLDTLPAPWGELKSIYAHIRSGLIQPLPDEHIIFQSNKVRWVGGAMDGVLGNQGGGKEKRVFGIVSALQALQQQADGKLLRRLYDLVVEDAVVGCIDAVLQELTGGSTSTDKSRVLEVGRYLATRAGHREAVKFGIALIGVFGADYKSSETRIHASRS